MVHEKNSEDQYGPRNGTFSLKFAKALQLSILRHMQKLIFHIINVALKNFLDDLNTFSIKNNYQRSCRTRIRQIIL